LGWRACADSTNAKSADYQGQNTQTNAGALGYILEVRKTFG
jgi:hypothetical protein